MNSKCKIITKITPHTFFTLSLILLNTAGCITIAVLLTGALLTGHTGQAQNTAPQTELNSVSQEDAIITAFSDAGVDNSCVKQLSYELICDSESSSGSGVYHVSFKALSNEYNYQISATDGRILSYIIKPAF